MIKINHFRLRWKNWVARKSVVNCGNIKKRTTHLGRVLYSSAVETVLEGKMRGRMSELTLIQLRWGIASDPYTVCFWQKVGFGLCHQLCQTGTAAGSWGALSPRKSLRELLSVSVQHGSRLTVTYGIRDNAISTTDIMV